ncbi:MAG: Ig-like domain-containing protein, partial [Thermoplasmata archaeon]
TPMTAGVAALVIQAMNEKNMSFNPIFVKNVIMNTAVDLYNPPYTQGAGQINAYYAVADVLGNNTVGAFYTTSYATYQNVMSQIYAMLDYWSSMFSSGVTYPTQVPMANWFAGYLSPGQSTQNTFTVTNPTNTTLTINIGTQNLVVTNKKSITLNWNTTNVSAGFYSWVRGWNGPYYAAEYINFTKVFGPIPSNVDMVAIEINSPYMVPWPNITSTFTCPGYITLFAYDWSGVTSNVTNYFGQTVQIPKQSQMNMVNAAYNWYNTQIITINMHANPFKMYPLIRTYMYNLNHYLPNGYFYNLSSINSEIWNLRFTLNVYYLQNQPIPWISFSQNSITLPPHGTATFTATLSIPNDASNGIYSGYIVLTGSNGFKQLIPSSVAIKTDVNQTNKVYTFGGYDKYSMAPLYNNGLMYGMGALDWRYESGDVRFYYFDVTSTAITGLNIQVVWNDPQTSMDVFVLDPYGIIIGSTIPMLWNYLGGGMFLPSNNMVNGTSLTVPVDGPGLYTIVVHQTNAGGGIWPIKVSGIIQTEGITLSNLSPYMYGQINANYEVVSPVPISKIMYRIDAGNWSSLPVNSLTYASGSIFTNLTSAGPHSIEIMMENVLGVSFSASYIVTIAPPPTVKITSPSNNAYVEGTINVTFSVNGSYISNIIATVDGIQYPLTGNNYLLLNTKTLTDGQHTITIKAVNMAGLYGSDTINIIVNNNNLLYAVIKSPSPGSFVKGTVNVTYVVSGINIKNVTLNLNNEVISVKNVTFTSGSEVMSSTFNSANYPDGNYVLKLIVNAENATYVTSESITILNTPPTVTITSPTPGEKLNGTITVSFTVTGDYVNSVWLYVDNMGYNVTGHSSYSINTSGLSDGNHTIKVVASNFAGSTNSTVVITTNNQALANEKTQNKVTNAVSSTYIIALPIGLIVGLLVGIPIGYILKKGKKSGVKPWQEPPKESTEEKKQ